MKLNRRQILGAAASAAALPAAAQDRKPVTKAGQTGGKRLRYIDAHSHVWTPDTTRYPLGPGYDKAAMKPASWTAEELIAASEPEGVGRVVLIQMSFYGFDNSYMLDCMERYPKRFGGVAVIDWKADRPDGDMARMARHGVRGFRVYPKDVPVERWMETPSFERMFAHARDHGLSLCPLIDPSALPSLTRMCERYPDTNIVIDHFCRIGITGTILDSAVEALAAMARFPKVNVKVSAFYALGQKKPPHTDLEPMTRRLHQAFGANRLMWASDCPFAVDNEKFRDAISLIRDGCSWLSDQDRAHLLTKTAERVFF